MKRAKLIKHLTKYGCYLIREGGNHSIYLNPFKQKISTVPRHREVKQFLVEKICKDLEIQIPSGK